VKASAQAADLALRGACPAAVNALPTRHLVSMMRLPLGA